VRDWESDAELRTFEGNPPEPVTVKDIAAQLIDVSPIVLPSLKVALGGGRAYFEPKPRLILNTVRSAAGVMAGI
jgi:hypothetical protein